jgi:hypothetical protein
MQVLLTSADVTANQFADGLPAAGIRQGGTIPIRNPTNPTEVIGDYSFLITFTSAFNPTTRTIGCIATGAYTFALGEQITWTASCSGLPFFSITGGQGSFTDAAGFVEFMIPAPTGFVHKINLCKGK